MGKRCFLPASTEGVVWDSVVPREPGMDVGNVHYPDRDDFFK